MTCEVATTFVKTFLETNEFQDFVAFVFYSDSNRRVEGLKDVPNIILKLGHN